MNTEQNLSSALGESSTTPLVKEVYHAPQVKIHGKLEKLTLQAVSPGADPTPTPGAGEGGGGL